MTIQWKEPRLNPRMPLRWPWITRRRLTGLYVGEAPIVGLLLFKIIHGPDSGLVRLEVGTVAAILSVLLLATVGFLRQVVVEE